MASTGISGQSTSHCARHLSSFQGYRFVLRCAMFMGIVAIGPHLPGLPSVPRAAATEPSYEGFGASTPGGAGQPLVYVTNLNDSGPGSFRQAVSQGNRIIVFQVGGDILLSKEVYVRGAFITIDGFTAPPPGITLRNYGLWIRGNKGAHDVIVRGIRVRDAWIDGIQIKEEAYNIVVDHVSIDGSTDGNLDITQGSHDITVSWSLIGEPVQSHPKSMLIKYNPARVSLHHNIFTANQRNPQVGIDDPGEVFTPAADTTLDMRNNLVWGWSNGYGTLVFYGAKANIVNNYYDSGGGDASDAVIVCKGDCVNTSRKTSGGDPDSLAWAYVSGNVSGDGFATINDEGNETVSFAAPSIDTWDACTAATLVLDEAGVRPLDSIDQGLVAPISLSHCNAPIADAGPDQTVAPGELVTLDGSGSSDPDGDLLTYSWDFGDGANSTGLVATHTYSAPSVYTITLTVSDGTFDSTDTAEITIPEVPGPLADAGRDQTVTLGSPATLDGSASSDPDGDPLTYKWDFGDGSTSIGNVPIADHVYAAPGVFTATLTVTDGTMTDADSALVAVNALPPTNSVPVAVAGPDQSVGVAQPVSLDGSGSSDADGDTLVYSWDLGDGNTATGITVNHIYGTPGTYTVALTVGDGLETALDTTIVTVTSTGVLFTDDFSNDSMESWTIVDEGSASSPSAWSIEDETLRQKSNIYGGSTSAAALPKPGTYALAGNPSWDDYLLTFRLRSTDNDAIGVMFRYENDDNYYRFSIDRQRNYRRLVKKENGVFILLAEQPGGYGSNQWHTVDVEANGSVLRVSLDGNLLFHVNDPSFAAGRIALYTWGNAGSYFDDFTVTELSP